MCLYLKGDLFPSIDILYRDLSHRSASGDLRNRSPSVTNLRGGRGASMFLRERLILQGIEKCAMRFIVLGCNSRTVPSFA